MPSTNPKTTPDLIAEQLRQDIAAGRYPDGAALRQDELARRFGVSKIPVREALQQLRSEGLVATYHNRGSVVVAASVAEVAEVYAMREALEVLALQSALPQLSEADLLRAEGALLEIDSVTEPSEWPRLNWEFHAALYRPARMELLLRTLETLHHSVARYLLIYLAEPANQHASQAEHRALLDACRRRDTAAAQRVLVAHLREASQQSQAFIAGEAPPASPTKAPNGPQPQEETV
ncbi:MAG: GntR family transcriptional regulator [Trueperaceae bacterium]